MEEYPIDVLPEQIVRWLGDEQRRDPHAFHVSATREFVDTGIKDFEANGVGADTDVDSVTAVGIVEVCPAQEPKGWQLRIRAEDDLGEHIPEDHSVEADPEEIDLETFEALFVAPGRAILDATLHAETPAARDRFQALAEAMMSDRHGD